MRVAFAVEGPGGLKARVSERFGRAPMFVIVELRGGEVVDVKEVENPGSAAPGGAAMRAVQKLVDEGVELVVAGRFGPNALAALQGAGIRYAQMHGVAVEEALERVKGEGRA